MGNLISKITKYYILLCPRIFWPPKDYCTFFQTKNINFTLSIMKLKDLKAWLENLNEAELEKELLYNSLDYGISGEVGEITHTDDNLYYVGDEPVLLHTEEELRKRGFTQKQIAELDVEIPQGCYYIELSNEFSILERFAH
jgi:hypothetical protein